MLPTTNESILGVATAADRTLETYIKAVLADDVVVSLSQL